MGTFSDINTLSAAAGAPVYAGYPATDAILPYVVHRPLSIAPGQTALNGSNIDWDHQYTLYACAAGVEASYNLAVKVMRILHGARVSGTTLVTSMGYTGALVEGHYESQITVQLNQGVI